MLSTNKRVRHKVKVLDVTAPKIAAAKSGNDFAQSLLQHETKHFKEISKGRRKLYTEHDQLNFTIEEYREGAYFDAVNYLEKDHAKAMSKPYKKEVLEMIVELVDCGIEENTVETVFERVFNSVNSELRNFPPSSRIKKLLKDKTER